MYYMENFPAQYQCTSLFCFPGISGMVSILGSSKIDRNSYLLKAWGFVGALCDLIIAIFMFVYVSFFCSSRCVDLRGVCQISKQTRQTSRVMQQSVVKIKRLTLETGFLTG